MRGTPRRSVKAQVESGKNVITINSENELNDVIEAVAEKYGYEAAKDFMKAFRLNIIYQLQSLPMSPHKVASSDGPLREQIIDSISEVKQTSDDNGNAVFSFSIDHELAVALNDGTGIYGEYKTPITVNNKYMFIPGEKYYGLMQKYVGKKSNYVSNMKGYSNFASINKSLLEKQNVSNTERYKSLVGEYKQLRGYK